MARRPASADLEPPSASPLLYVLGGALLLSAALSFLLPEALERPGIDAEPPAPKRLRFQISPPGVPGAYVALVREDGAQRIAPPGEVFEIEASGPVHWTAAAPGYQSRSGVVELPYGPDSTPERVVEVTLEPMRGGPPR